MTFANAGPLAAVPGRRDELVAHLTQPTVAPREPGCLCYQVGVNDEAADTVFVIEL